MSSEKLISSMMKQNIPYNFWADNGDTSSGRLMFVPDMRHKKFRSILRHMLRGAIFKMPENELIVNPEQSIMYLDFKDQTEMINSKIARGDYKIYKAYDNTTVTLYVYKDTYCIGSNSCPDISSVIWNGEVSFAKMIYDVAIKTAPEFVEAIGLELTDCDRLVWNLPSEIAITINFRNHNIHLLTGDPECIQLVHAMNMKTHEKVVLPELASITKDRQEVNISSVEDAIKKVENSLVKAVYGKRTDRFNYGYILEDKNESMYPKIFISSDLYSLLRESIYSSTLTRKDTEAEIRYITNIMYICLSRREIMLENLKKVLPQLADMITSCSAFVEEICEKVKVFIEDPKLDDESVTAEIGSIIKVNEPDYSPSTNTKYNIVKNFVYKVQYVHQITQEYLNSKNM